VTHPRRPCGDEIDGRIAYDELPDGLVVADDAGQVTLVNRRAEVLLALPADELVGKDLAQVLPLTDRRGMNWWSVVDPYGGLAIRTGHSERSLLLLDREVLVCSAYVRDEPLGRVRRVVVTFRSAAVQARCDRRRAEAVTTAAEALRSALARVTAGTATLVEAGESLGERARLEVLATVDAGANRAARLMADLLDASRIDCGRLELRRRRIDLVDLIGARVARRDCSTMEFVAEPVSLRVDPERIDQVLGNLIENARIHGGGKVTVALERCAAGGATITVSDEGPGIPCESIAAAFDRFWRAPGQDGPGLGLYIARGIVEAHGGTIGIGRAAGGGAAVRFTLPAD
jgi:signal transduction histidine kinase